MPLTKSQLAETWVNFLTAEGYPCDIDGDGDVKFKCEGGTYFIMFDEQDPSYFRLIFPGFWPINHEMDRPKVLQACDYATATTKVVKVYTVRDNVWAAIELLAENPDQVKPMFSRMIRMIRAAVSTFAEKAKA